MRQMSTACLFPFRRGKPDATMYASPMVSTFGDGEREMTDYLVISPYIVQITYICVCVCVYLIDVMAVEDAVEVFIHVVEHVHHLHWCAVVAEGSEAHNIAEVDGDLVK